jgi:sugar transferase (PEP-CTERM system associated)
MHINLVGRYIHSQLAVLGLVEFLAAVSAYLVICGFDSAAPLRMFLIPSFIYGLCVIVCMIALGLFTRRQRDRWGRIFLRIVICVLAAGLLSIILSAAYAAPHVPFVSLVKICGLACVLVALMRIAANSWLDMELFKRRVLVIGAGNSAGRIGKLRRLTDSRGFKVIGYLPMQGEAVVVDSKKLVTVAEPLAQYAASRGINEIVVGMDDKRQSFPLRELLACRLAGIEVISLVSFLERETGKVYLDILNPSWMIFSKGFRRDNLRRINERVFDLAASAILLVCNSPLLLLVAIAIKLEDGLRAPIFYRQERVGFGGKVFRLVKFRSMRIDAERNGNAQWASANDERVTRVGRFIRKLRIDEMPQILNVCRGDMRFVGPRPERPNFVASLQSAIPYYEYRHTVKPGITGWAQLCYPYGASQEDAAEKLQYDLYYVKNHGLLFDLLILLSTAEVILFAKGAR